MQTRTRRPFPAMVDRPARDHRRARAGARRVRQQLEERLVAERSSCDVELGHAAARLLPERHARARRSSASQNGIVRRQARPNVKLELKTFNSGTEATTALLAGAIDASFVGPNPAINAYQKTNGGIRIVAGTASGGAVPRREAEHQQRGRPQGQEDRDAAARQHPGRRAAHVVEQERPARDQGRRRRHDRPRGQLGHAHRVRVGRDRRRVGARAVGDAGSSTEGGGKILVNEATLWPEGQVRHHAADGDEGASSTRTPTSSRTSSAGSPTRSTSSRRTRRRRRTLVGRRHRQGDRQAAEAEHHRRVVRAHHVHARPDRVVAADRRRQRQGARLPEVERPRQDLRPHPAEQGPAGAGTAAQSSS